MIAMYCGVGTCYAPRSRSHLHQCENYHPWDDDLALFRSEVEEKLMDRVAELTVSIDSAPCWGAAVSVMGEERKNIQRRLNHWKAG